MNLPDARNLAILPIAIPVECATLETERGKSTKEGNNMAYELQMAIEYGATTEELLALAGVDPEELED